MIAYYLSTNNHFFLIECKHILLMLLLGFTFNGVPWSFPDVHLTFAYVNVNAVGAWRTRDVTAHQASRGARLPGTEKPNEHEADVVGADLSMAHHVEVQLEVAMV